MYLRSLCVSRSACVILAAAFLSLPVFFISFGLLSPTAFAQRMPQSSPLEKLGSSTIGVCNSSGLDVEANGVSTPYTSLSTAFANINLGIHTGEIVIEVCGDTTHTGSAYINSSGAGSANYSSILIRPMVDSVRISSETVAGKGVIELNGADNVTIDGDNPLTPGVNRNLTIENIALNTVLRSQVIRIALNQSNVFTADQNVFKNLNLIGNAKDRNITLDLSPTGSPGGTTFGILASSGSTSPIGEPGEVSSPTQVIGGSTSIANLVIENNAIISVGRGISINGSAETVFPGLIIRSNSIGNPIEGELDQVYLMGVTVQGSVDALIEDNSIWVESYIRQSDGGIRALDHGFVSNSGSGTGFESNKVLRVRNNATSTAGATGINLQRGSSHRVINNFVANVINPNTGGAFNQVSSAAGIRTASNGPGGHRILHNSVHLTGAMINTAGATVTAALALWYSATPNMVVRNNIFSNQITGGHSGTRHVAVALLGSGVWTYNLVLDNNAYFSGMSSNSRLAQVGTSPGSGEYAVANFNSADNSNPLNLRTYTWGLIDSHLHQNDSNSFASTAPPPFVSDTDLHLVPASGFQIEAGGADVGVGVDIDGDVRDQAPEIGADELFAPTSAGVSITGRVVTAGGRGVYGARVTAVTSGGTLTAVANPFGYYRFTGLAAGGSAAVTVSAKGRTFATPTRFITLEDDIAGLDFIAEW